MIHLTIPGSGWFHTTVSNNPESKRYHPNMFKKLRRVLEEQNRWPGGTSSQPEITSEVEVASEIEASSGDLEREFHEAMATIYVRAKEEANYNATRYLQMVSEVGGLETARRLLSSSGVSDGFTHLWERKRLDLSVENLVLQDRWAPLFSERERQTARDRLAEYGYQF